MRSRFLRAGLIAAALALAIGITSASAATPGHEALVTTGAPAYVPGPFPENKQNEPALAVNPTNPNMLVAGANEEIDLELCHAPAKPTESPCPFTPGVGTSGVYFSMDGGLNWKQPTYHGLTARGCVSTQGNNQNPCPYIGPIGTLPKYSENKLTSDGDPAVTFGPVKGPNGCSPPSNPAPCFSYDNGTRLYYANLTAKLQDARSEETFRGYEAIYVSRTDHPEVAMTDGPVGESAWSSPVLVSPRSSSTTFRDKENIWADNAASSPYFGNVYLCWTDFRSNGVFNGVSGDPEPIEVIRSTDGGNTWDQQQQISPADDTAASNPLGVGGRQGCATRTDSNGVVYVFWEGYDIPNKQEVMFMSRSFDGGKSWEKQTPIFPVRDVGAFDPNQDDFTFDGVGGARTDSFPSVDIANGAPLGFAAPNTIVMTWSDGTGATQNPNTCCRGTVAGERAIVAYSNARGEPGSWTRTVASEPSDRPDFPAVAISPDGQNVLLTYMNFLQPWQLSPLAPPRLMQGVVKTAALGTTGLSPFTDVYRGPVGDARGSSSNFLDSEFLGDYNYAVQTNDGGAVVFNDVRAATDCPVEDAHRQAVFAYSTGSSSNNPPAPNPDVTCPATFGNSDIWSWSTLP